MVEYNLKMEPKKYMLEIQMRGKLIQHLLVKKHLEYPSFYHLSLGDCEEVETIKAERDNYQNMKDGDTYCIIAKSFNMTYPNNFYKIIFSHAWENSTTAIKKLENYKIKLEDHEVVSSYKVFDANDNRISLLNEKLGERQRGVWTSSCRINQRRPPW